MMARVWDCLLFWPVYASFWPHFVFSKYFSENYIHCGCSFWCLIIAFHPKSQCEVLLIVSFHCSLQLIPYIEECAMREGVSLCRSLRNDAQGIAVAPRSTQRRLQHSDLVVATRPTTEGALVGVRMSGGHFGDLRTKQTGGVHPSPST